MARPPTSTSCLKGHLRSCNRGQLKVKEKCHRFSPDAHRERNISSEILRGLTMKSSERVVIVGASPNPERYSHKAHLLLKEYGHTTVLVNPGHNEIDGQRCFRSLAEAARETGPIDSVTVYLSPQHSSSLQGELDSIRPRRVIFNPGAENEALATFLRKSGVEVVYGCTLVMLRTGTF